MVFLFECLAAGCVYVFDRHRGRGWIGGRVLFVLREDKLLMMVMEDAQMF